MWNPSTGEFRELPNLISQKYRVCAFGFCYDEVNDDFKVFSIFVRRGGGHGHSEYEVSVLQIFPMRVICITCILEGFLQMKRYIGLLDLVINLKLLFLYTLKQRHLEKSCLQNTEKMQAGGPWAHLAKAFPFIYLVLPMLIFG